LVWHKLDVTLDNIQGIEFDRPVANSVSTFETQASIQPNNPVRVRLLNSILIVEAPAGKELRISLYSPNGRMVYKEVTHGTVHIDTRKKRLVSGAYVVDVEIDHKRCIHRKKVFMPW